MYSNICIQNRQYFTVHQKLNWKCQWISVAIVHTDRMWSSESSLIILTRKWAVFASVCINFKLKGWMWWFGPKLFSSSGPYHMDKCISYGPYAIKEIIVNSHHTSWQWIARREKLHVIITLWCFFVNSKHFPGFVRWLLTEIEIKWPWRSHQLHQEELVKKVQEYSQKGYIVEKGSVTSKLRSEF